MHIRSLKDWEYVRRVEPSRTRRRRYKRGIGMWFLSVAIDLKRLLADRGGKDAVVETYIRNPDLIYRSNSTAIGEEVELTLAERQRLGITCLRPFDVPWRECRRLYKEQRNIRKRERARQKRLRDGCSPQNESLSKTKPWEAEGVSRSTWYRKRKSPVRQLRATPYYVERAAQTCLTPSSTSHPEGRPMLNLELRPYQLEAIQNIRDTVKGGVRRLIVQAATGAGKTKIAASIINMAREKRNCVAFVVPAISLVDQTFEAFYREGIRDVGVIQGNHVMENWAAPVQICSIQTIRRRGAYPQSQVVIFDEVHQFHQAHKDWLGHPDWQNVPMIGLSATPWTKGLGKYFDSLLVAATTRDLIEQGYLSKFKVFAAGHPDLSEVKVVAGDYHEGQLSGAMQKGELTADIIKTYQELWGQGKTLCFGVDKAHAKSIQERFEHAGISCGYQDADTTPQERAELKRKFHNGEYQVVSNIQTLTTGVDWDVRCLILARPTRSEMLYTQIIGRALRTAPGKDAAIILDHSDTTQRLGFVTDIHHDQLSEAKGQVKKEVEKKPKLPKECEKCTALMPPGVLVCSNCGHEIIIRSSVVEGNGVLQEMQAGKKLKAKSRIYTMSEKSGFLAELKAIAIRQGYSSGWASHKFKSKFGVWPDHSIRDVRPAKIVSPDVSLFVRAENIRWAKSKQSGANAQ